MTISFQAIDSTTTAILSNGVEVARVTATGLRASSSGQTNTLEVVDPGANGANVKLVGNGATTPNKFIRAQNGLFQIVNSAYSAVIYSLTDAGELTLSTSGSITTLHVQDTGANGANIKLTGNGGTTPTKFLRVTNGSFQVINSAYSAAILTLDDAGNLSVPGTMKSGVMFRGYMDNGTQTVATNTLTRVSMTGETVDTHSAFDVATVPGRFTAPIAGWYQFNTKVHWTTGVSEVFSQLIKNGVTGSPIAEGSTSYTNTNGVRSTQINDVVLLAAGDTVDLYVWHAQTVNCFIQGNALGTQTFFGGYLVRGV